MKWWSQSSAHWGWISTLTSGKKYSKASYILLYWARGIRKEWQAGVARHGMARLGGAGTGRARQAWPGKAGPGLAWPGAAWQAGLERD